MEASASSISLSSCRELRFALCLAAAPLNERRGRDKADRKNTSKARIPDRSRLRLRRHGVSLRFVAYWSLT